VKQLLKKLSTDEMVSFLTLFSSFKTRYYKSSSGKEASEFMFSKVKTLTEQAKVPVTVKKFLHPWNQFSVIARIESSCNNTKRQKSLLNQQEENEFLAKEETNLPVVIIGAHLDSINQYNPWFGRSPGRNYLFTSILD
jgi:leucyl aminopeptidase